MENGVALKHVALHICFVFEVLHKLIMLSWGLVIQAGKLVQFRKPKLSVLTAVYTARSLFIHSSFYCRRKMSWQVQSHCWSCLLCQETNSSWESFMQHWNVLLGGTFSDSFLASSFILWLRGTGWERFQTSERYFVCLCAVVRDRNRELMQAFCTVIIKLCIQITNQKVTRLTPRSISKSRWSQHCSCSKKYVHLVYLLND